MPMHDWTRVDAGIFHDFHLMWIARIRTELNERILPDPFYALAEPVVGGSVPDVLALGAQESGGEGDVEPRSLVSDDAQDCALAVSPARVVVQELGPAYARLGRRISIWRRARKDRLVAVIEVVSPGNKDARSRVQAFLDTSLSFLEAGIHVLVIDVHASTPLVPAGFHGLIAEALGHGPPEHGEGRDREAVSYQVIEDGLTRAHFVALGVGDALPDMPVFLLPHHFARIPLEGTYADAFRSIPRKFAALLGD